MVYEFIATIAAAFGFAGIALLIKHLASVFKFSTPKWLTPVFAALGIFAFQIHQEYNWYAQTVSQLPKHVSVVKTIENTAWYRPWSYVKPQTVRFMAVDMQAKQTNQLKSNMYLVSLYLFERRMSTQHVPQVVDCQLSRRADYFSTDKTPDLQALHWVALSHADPLLQTVCG